MRIDVSCDLNRKMSISSWWQDLKLYSANIIPSLSIQEVWLDCQTDGDSIDIKEFMNFIVPVGAEGFRIIFNNNDHMLFHSSNIIDDESYIHIRAESHDFSVIFILFLSICIFAKLQGSCVQDESDYVNKLSGKFNFKVNSIGGFDPDIVLQNIEKFKEVLSTLFENNSPY